MRMSRRRILIGGSVAAAAVAALVVVASLSGLLPVDLGLGAVGGSSGLGTDEGSALETTTTTKAQTGDGQTDGGSGGTQSATPGSPSTGGSGSTGSTGSGTSAGGSSQPGQPSDPKDPAPPKPSPKPGETVEFKILWWNETAEKSPGGFEVVFGSNSVKPDASKRGGSATLAGSVVGKEQKLTVYPDGRSGRKFEVSFTHDQDMAPLTETDAIHVEVSDTKVRVLGNPVDNFDHAFDRF